MNEYNDLELSILSCLLQKPELMKENKLEDKYFIKHKKIWYFMKAFYKKFKNFDITLMMAVSKNKFRMIEYITWLIEQEPATSLFNEYVEELKQEYYELKKNKYIREKIYELSCDLMVNNITPSEFLKKSWKIYQNSEKIYKE